MLRWAFDVHGQRRPIARRYLFDALARVTPAIAVDTEGLRLHLSTSDREVAREIFALGPYELHTMARAEHELRSRGRVIAGREFLDLGANLGSATCLALTRHGLARSWAFEPAPANIALLRHNLIANDLEPRTSVHACALSDRDGSLVLELSPDNWGDHRIRVGPRPDGPFGEGSRGTLEVPARRLDSFVESGAIELAEVGLAWLDVQGHEAQLLDGARELLRSPVPIVCELWPYGLRRGAGLERFLELVASSRPTFVDLGAAGSRERPTSELGELAARLDGLAATDVLLLA